jgi:hypothetical protein
MAEEADSLDSRLSRIETHLQVNNQLLNTLLMAAFGGSGGGGGSAGAGGAAGGGGGSAGGAGGGGGVVVNAVQFDPSPELLDWVREQQQPELAAALEAQDPVRRAEGWARFKDWLVRSAVSMPAGVAAALVASVLPH